MVRMEMGMSKLWEEVMKKGREQEKGITHRLTKDEVTTIIATADALGVNETFLNQLIWDLTVARYKLFDEIGMLLTGRYKGYPNETPQEVEAGERFTKIMASLYITESIPNMIHRLRTDDYLLEGVYKNLISRAKKKLEEVV